MKITTPPKTIPPQMILMLERLRKALKNYLVTHQALTRIIEQNAHHPSCTRDQCYERCPTWIAVSAMKEIV